MHRRAALLSGRVAEVPKAGPAGGGHPLPSWRRTPNQNRQPQDHRLIGRGPDRRKRTQPQASLAGRTLMRETQKSDRRLDAQRSPEKEATQRPNQDVGGEGALVRAPRSAAPPRRLVRHRSSWIPWRWSATPWGKNAMRRRRHWPKHTCCGFVDPSTQGSERSLDGPLIVECRNGTVGRSADGRSFLLLVCRSGGGIRSSPFIMAVAREVIRIGAMSARRALRTIYLLRDPSGWHPSLLRITWPSRNARDRPSSELVDQVLEIDFSGHEQTLDGRFARGRALDFSRPGSGGEWRAYVAGGTPDCAPIGQLRLGGCLCLARPAFGCSWRCEPRNGFRR